MDIRPQIEYEICRLPEARNIPLEELKTLNMECFFKKIYGKDSKNIPNLLYVICHRGNDSQIAVALLREKLDKSGYSKIYLRDLIGGYDRWALDVDQTFPRY